MPDKKEHSIKIVKDGPYIVSGNVPLSEKIITPKGRGYEYKEGGELPQAKAYALCRCGRSKIAPFCDSSHEKTGFDGTETASRDKYEDRAELLEGPSVDLLDDSRCAYARFCHREKGNVWELTGLSDTGNNKEEAIQAASDCPTGRLSAVDKEGNIIEPFYQPAVDILQDPEKGVSGGIFVKGYIPVEASDGQVYETRNRVTLCRCGKSRNKPFCDAAHVRTEFTDGL